MIRELTTQIASLVVGRILLILLMVQKYIFILMVPVLRIGHDPKLALELKSHFSLDDGEMILELILGEFLTI